jgi:hypothetical protein
MFFESLARIARRLKYRKVWYTVVMVSYLKILNKCVGIPVLKNLYPDPDPGVLKSMTKNPNRDP